MLPGLLGGHFNDDISGVLSLHSDLVLNNVYCFFSPKFLFQVSLGLSSLFLVLVQHPSAHNLNNVHFTKDNF